MKLAQKLEYTLYTLLTIGIIYMFNATAVHSKNVYGTPYKFFINHLVWVFVGLLIYFLFRKIKVKNLKKISTLFYGFSFLFLLILAIAGMLPCAAAPVFTPCLNNANRWLFLNPEPLPQIPFLGELGFQPSEFAKLALIFFLSAVISKLIDHKKVKDVPKATLIYTGVFALLVLLQPNMSTAITFIVIGLALYFMADAPIKPLLLLIPLGLILGVLLILVSPYRRERLLTYIDPSRMEKTSEEGYQVRQVKIALGSGGFFGRGFGESRQKYTYLPEVSTDSIFGVIGEELGFLGAGSIVVLFSFLLYLGIQTSIGAVDTYSRLVAVGVTTWFGFQFFVHLFANLGLIPYTGVPLPFISYGGSSLVFSLAAYGTLVNISKENNV